MSDAFKPLPRAHAVMLLCGLIAGETLAQPYSPSPTEGATLASAEYSSKEIRGVNKNVTSVRKTLDGITYEELTTKFNRGKGLFRSVTTIKVITGLPTNIISNINSSLIYPSDPFLENACSESGCVRSNVEKKVEWVTPYQIAVSSYEETCELRCGTSWGIDVYDTKDGAQIQNTYNFKLALWALKYLRQESHYQSQGLFRWCDKPNDSQENCFYGAGVDPISLYPKGNGIEVYASIGIQDHAIYERLGFVPLSSIPSNIIFETEFWKSYLHRLKIKPAPPKKSPILVPICSHHEYCLPEIRTTYAAYLKLQQSIVETDQSEETLNKLRDIDEAFSARIDSCTNAGRSCLNKAANTALSAVQVFKKQAHQKIN